MTSSSVPYPFSQEQHSAGEPANVEVDSEGLDPQEIFKDNAEVAEFISKYGDVSVKFIEPPERNPYFTTPYALNFFYKGVLYRTKHERSSSIMELFIDLVYVGVAANLASSAVASHSWASAAKYILLFAPAWMIWSSLKEFMNYYYNEDLLQMVFVVWELVLLLIYDNNCEALDDVNNTSAWLAVVISYTSAGFSFALILLFYSIWVKEHRTQMRIYACCVLFTSGCWYFIFLIPTFGYRGVFALIWLLVEQLQYAISVHPWFKRLLKLEYSTALNIEHEDERFHSFYVIAIGEFVYSINAESPLSVGWNDRLSKGISLLINAVLFMALYSHKDGSRKATHALRNSPTTSMVYIYSHFFVIGALLIVGDAGADLSKIHVKYLEPDEYGVLFYYHVGIFVALCALTVIAAVDIDRTDPGFHQVSKFWRIGFRVPIGALIFGLTWGLKDKSIKETMWIDTMLLFLLFGYEFIVMNPWRYYFGHNRLVEL